MTNEETFTTSNLLDKQFLHILIQPYFLLLFISYHETEKHCVWSLIMFTECTAMDTIALTHVCFILLVTGNGLIPRGSATKVIPTKQEHLMTKERRKELRAKEM